MKNECLIDQKDYNLFYLFRNQQNVKICQYLSLEYFITHLTRGEYFIQRKNLFNDANEKKLPLSLMFAPTLANAPCSEKNTEIIEKQIEKYELYKEVSNSSFVSSWTLAAPDNYLMWKSYAPNYGVCVVSCIEDFIASFNHQRINDYEIYCAPIDYRNYKFTDTPEDMLFIKSVSYKDESELRFLFSPKNETMKNERNIWVPYQYQIMIDKVILSPFLSPQIVGFLSASLREKFSIEVCPSLIKIDNSK